MQKLVAVARASTVVSRVVAIVVMMVIGFFVGIARLTVASAGVVRTTVDSGRLFRGNFSK